MSIPLITAGFILLLNPCVWLWDIFPDFIGAILILIGMKKAAFINDTSERMNVDLLTISVISALKLALAVLFRNDPGMTKLLSSFIFALLEAIYLIKLFKGSFSLFELLQMRFCDQRETTPFVSMESTGKMLSIYTVCRLVVGFLPEISEFSSKNYNPKVDDGRMGAKWMLYLMAAAVTVIAFVIVSLLLIKAMKRFSSDRATIDNSAQAVEDMKRADVSEWYSKKWKFYKYIFVAGFLFSIFLYIDWIDYFPKVIAAVLFCILTVYCSKNAFERILATVVNALLSVSSVISALAISAFKNNGEYLASLTQTVNYDNETVTERNDTRLRLLLERNPDAKADYFKITVLLIIVALLFFASVMLMTEFVKRRRTAELVETNRKEARIKKFKREILLLRLFATGAAASALAYPLLRPYFPEIYVFLIVFGVASAVMSHYTDLVD